MVSDLGSSEMCLLNGSQQRKQRLYLTVGPAMQIFLSWERDRSGKITVCASWECRGSILQGCIVLTPSWAIFHLTWNWNKCLWTHGNVFCLFMERYWKRQRNDRIMQKYSLKPFFFLISHEFQNNKFAFKGSTWSSCTQTSQTSKPEWVTITCQSRTKSWQRVNAPSIWAAQICSLLSYQLVKFCNMRIRVCPLH